MNKIFQQLQKYNFWDQAPQNLGFLRTNYLNKTEQYLNNRLVKIIVGQRRTGKSFLLRQIIHQLISQGILKTDIFYLNKEYTEFDAIKTYQDLNKLLQHYQQKFPSKNKKYIFLDEIQTIDEWEKLINSLSQNHLQEYEIFITGSNSQLLSSELASLLTGRYVQIYVAPFSYQEYIAHQKLEPNKQSYLEYLKLGGLPELSRLTEEESRRQYVSALKDSILLHDIVARYKIKDAYLLEQLFNFFINNIGNLSSINKITNYLKSKKINTSYDTLSNYAQYLQYAFLIHEIPRYDIRGKQILDGAKKYFLNDLAFRTYLSSVFDYGYGQRLENAIFLHYLSTGAKIHIGTVLGTEVDFIIEKNDQKTYVQVAYSIADPKTAEREMTSLRKIKDAYPKQIITLDDISFGNQEGIQHLLAWDL